MAFDNTSWGSGKLGCCQVGFECQQYVAVACAGLREVAVVGSDGHLTSVFEGDGILGRLIAEPVEHDRLHDAVLVAKHCVVDMMALQQAITFRLTDYVVSRPTT